MRTFTTKHTVYTVDELNTEARERAIEDARNGEWEYGLEWLGDAMMEQLSELLEKHKIYGVDTQVHYSLSYCQGDGASFTGDIEWGAWRATIEKNHWGNHYSHSKSVSVTEMTSIKTDKEAPEATMKKLEAIVESIGDELEKYGYDCIEDATSDETLLENLRANEYEFYKNGAMA